MSDFLRQAESLFHQVRVLDPSAQAQRLDQIGRLEPALRAAVAALLQADSTPDKRLDKPIRDVVFGEIRAADRLLQSDSGAKVHQVATPRRPSERYHDRREIGRGGMGTVYRIRDATLDRDLAMKVIGGAGGSPAQPDQVLRFLREARVLARLDHPGIVPIHDLGVDEDGRPFFTMKLVQGDGASGDQLGERRTLEDVLDLTKVGASGWSLTRVLEILLRVCDALAYAHARGVRHRDLKPSNVMVGRFGEVYVMDWGLAQIQNDPTLTSPPGAARSGQTLEPHPTFDGTSELTATGDLLGTPEYMAPEQAQSGESDQRADIYSLGAILYRALAGVPPYQDGTAPKKRRASHQVLARLCQGPPRAVVDLAPNSSAELVAICERAMERKREDRYAHVERLAGDLRAFLEGRVVHAYETGAWAEARKWIQRNKPLSAAMAAAVLAIALGGGAFAVKAREATDARDSVARKNVELESTNAALEKAKSDALNNAALAQQQANDVLALSTQKDLDDLVVRADRLWPADPEVIPEYEAWLKEAHELIEGRLADPAGDLKRRLSLEEHCSKLAQLRTQAIPMSAEQVQSEHESHPKFTELQAKRAELTWHSRMLGLEPWPSESEAEVQLAAEMLPSDANGLNALAWQLADTSRPLYGSEVKARLLALRAVAAAPKDKRSEFRDTLAWALFRLGRFDEALAEEEIAVAELNGNSLTESAANLERAVSSWRGEELSKRRERRDSLAAEVSDLERMVSERRAFEYGDPEARWWDVQLSKLVANLEALRDPKHGLMGDVLAEPFGWGVAKRYEFAKHIRERSIDGPEAKKLWADAIASIHSSPKYDSLTLTPQMGLLPIGMDPDSGLWEFSHLQTGERTVRGGVGKLVVTEQTGLVFVLIPGGTSWLGAQKADEDGQNYDPQALDLESPVHEVTLSPYFLSKYEMTQGQWLRIAGRNPSSYGPSTSLDNYQHDLTHPVEVVTWTASMALMERLGLQLPSEAQWEFGCRGGTDTPWWTGRERESLRGKVNLADQTAKKALVPWPAINDWPDLEDGWAFHAPVGSLAANPYGLHGVHGNVWEWCRDGFGEYSAKKLVDPFISWAGDRTGREPAAARAARASHRVFRGGGFAGAALNARSANRGNSTPETQNNVLGLRPARGIRP